VADPAGRLVKDACDLVVAAAAYKLSALQDAWDNLDLCLKQWIVMGVSMALSFIPVVGPLISCIVDGTFVDMIKALSTGDWATLGMCALAFVPGGKIVGKVGKFVGHADDIGKATKNLRKNLIKATGKDPGKAFEAHHNLPKKFESFFNRKGVTNIHDAKYGSWVEKGKHRSEAYAVNRDWEDAITSGRVFDKESIETYAKELANEYSYEIRF
jgi:hypothetical protein